MPRFAHAFGSVATLALAAVLGLSAAPAIAQSGPTDIPAVMTICTPIIGEQYSGDDERWGQCVAAVGTFLTNIGAPSDATNATVADLVVALTELYQSQEECLTEETELPLAIDLAAQKTTDELQQAQILEVSATIKDCVVFQTAEIVPASAF